MRVLWLVYLGSGLLVFIAGKWIGPVFLVARSADARWVLFSQYLGWLGCASFLVLGVRSWLYERHKQSLLVRMSGVDALRRMHWTELEEVVVGMYQRLGYRATRVGGNGPDGGIDVVLHKAGEKILVQCKQWRSQSVSVGVVRELLGSMSAEGARYGVVITCGTFTGSAWKFASDNRIELIDGMRLVQKVAPIRGDILAGKVEPAVNFVSGDVKRDCPVCKGLMVRRSRSPMRGGGSFLGCTRYPVCKGTRPD